MSINHLIIIRLAKKKILYSHHATIQMNSEERLILTEEVREIIHNGEIIEERTDNRGDTYLISGKTSSGRYVHVVCSPKLDYLGIITAYIPNTSEWSDGFTKRKR